MKKGLHGGSKGKSLPASQETLCLDLWVRKRPEEGMATHSFCLRILWREWAWRATVHRGRKDRYDFHLALGRNPTALGEIYESVAELN